MGLVIFTKPFGIILANSVENSASLENCYMIILLRNVP
jgi:hypothetical protein